MAKNPHAVALGRMGGLARRENLDQDERKASAKKAGAARMKTLSPERRKEIARIAGKASAAARAKKARSGKR
jgi:hypothetical protein